MQIFKDEGAGKVTKIVMRKPADMHQHLRQDDMLKLVAPMVAKRFYAAIIMPNTVPPITTASMAENYRGDIDTINGPDFMPLMTLYLTDTLDPMQVRIGFEGGVIYAIKYYPPGLTTNSDSGVKDPTALWTKGSKPYTCLRALADCNGVFLIHAADGVASLDCEIGDRSYKTGDQLDPYDQELHFIAYTLHQIREAHPDLKISVEHLSTSLGVEYVRKFGGEKLGCSLTAQHLLLDRRDSFRKGKQMGFNPHRFWWPVIQPKEHRDELRKFAAEGHPFVWLGSDSAPHPVGKKETDCCTGGVLMAHAGIELYAEAFEDMGELDKFEEFASINGPRFFDLKPSEETITLVQEEWKVEQPFFTDAYIPNWAAAPNTSSPNTVVPFRLGETIRWKLAD